MLCLYILQLYKEVMEKFWILELRESRAESTKESRGLVLDFTATTIKDNEFEQNMNHGDGDFDTFL